MRVKSIVARIESMLRQERRLAFGWTNEDASSMHLLGYTLLKGIRWCDAGQTQGSRMNLCLGGDMGRFC